MKNIKLVFSVLVIALFYSCQDAIDIVQPGELPTAKTFTSVDDLKKGVLAVYPQMSIIPEISFNSIFPDEVKLGFANGGQGLNDGTYSFILNPNSADANAIWFGNYGCINSANRVLTGADTLRAKLVKVNPADPNIASIDDIKAQLKIMRAFANFRLLSYFSDLNTPSNYGVADSGVMLLDHVPTQSEHLPRATVQQVIDFINADLTYAATNLSNNMANSDNTYVSLDFIMALKARMAIYTSDYANALTYANSLINGDPANTINSYALSSQQAYTGIWSDSNPVRSDEVIFKLAHIKNEAQIGAIWASVDATITGSPFFTMSTDLYNLLSGGQLGGIGDIRYTAFVGGDSDPSYNSGGKGKVVIIKYTGKGTGTNQLALLNDEKIFRVSEMYLIKAEAQVGLGLYGDAQTTLQALSDMRFGFDLTGNAAPTIPTPTGLADGMAQILTQRRIEMCYEGHRYLDLKRLAVKAGVNLERNVKDCTINGACFLAGSSTLLKFMPIPNAEIAANKACHQNPGY